MQIQLTLDECESFHSVKAQRTLDGKPLYPVSDADFVKIVDHFARRSPERFATYCEKEFGITYKESPSLKQTLLCSAVLQETFGFFTENMINALMNYSRKGD